MLQKIVPYLPALNLAYTMAFYRDKLDFSAIHYGDCLVVSKQQISLQFFEYNGKGPLPLSTCCIYVDNIVDLYGKLSSLELVLPGGQLKNPTSYPKEFVVLDNNGHRLLFKQN